MVPIMLGYKSPILAEQKVSQSFQVAEERLLIRNSFEERDVQLWSWDGGIDGVASHLRQLLSLVTSRLIYV